MAYISLHSDKRVSPVLFARSVHDAIVKAYEFVPVEGGEVWSVTDGAQAYNFNVLHTSLGTALTNSRIVWQGPDSVSLATYFGVGERPSAVAIASRFALWMTVAAGFIIGAIAVGAGY